MPAHHKASTMWAQAVYKTCFKSRMKGKNLQGLHRNAGAILRPPAITPNDPRNSRQSRRSDEHLTAKLWRLWVWICHGHLITVANIVGTYNSNCAGTHAMNNLKTSWENGKLGVLSRYQSRMRQWSEKNVKKRLFIWKMFPPSWLTKGFAHDCKFWPWGANFGWIRESNGWSRFAIEHIT